MVHDLNLLDKLDAVPKEGLGELCSAQQGKASIH